MIAFVASMPRSGSMWVYNISRALIRACGRTPIPEIMSPDEVLRINQAFQIQLGENEDYIIKTHEVLKPDLPGVKIIYTYRDVRDSMLSYMRFMHCGSNVGINNMIINMQLTDYYFEKHAHNIIRIRYDDIISTPVIVINKIGDFMDRLVPQKTAESIADQFSRENVKKIINTLENVAINETEKIQGSAELKDFEIVSNSDGSYRVIDKKTRFQTNHITSKKEGEWRDVLSEEKKEEVMRLASDWLKKYDFSL